MSSDNLSFEKNKWSYVGKLEIEPGSYYNLPRDDNGEIIECLNSDKYLIKIPYQSNIVNGIKKQYVSLKDELTCVPLSVRNLKLDWNKSFTSIIKPTLSIYLIINIIFIKFIYILADIMKIQTSTYPYNLDIEIDHHGIEVHEFSQLREYKDNPTTCIKSRYMQIIVQPIAMIKTTSLSPYHGVCIKPYQNCCCKCITEYSDNKKKNDPKTPNDKLWYIDDGSFISSNSNEIVFYYDIPNEHFCPSYKIINTFSAHVNDTIDGYNDLNNKIMQKLIFKDHNYAHFNKGHKYNVEIYKYNGFII